MTSHLDANMFDVIIEVPQGSNIKYEINDNHLRVDRIVPHPYPFNYGFIDKTLSLDGDCIDVVLVSDHVFMPRSVVPCKIVGMIYMEDEEGDDPKLIAVPVFDSNSGLPGTTTTNQMPHITAQTIDQIVSFFNSYKLHEKDRWSRVKGTGSLYQALDTLAEAEQRWQIKKKKSVS